MTILEKLKETRNINEFAMLLGYKPKILSYILYIMPKTEKSYELFTIPKKNGCERKINAPNEKLKILQRRLASLLYNCYDEIVKDKKGISELSHGFKRKHSIYTNSLKHCKKRYVFNVDLKDFFPSINFGRVRGYFISDKNFRLNEKVATIIAQVACYNNELPQGSPLSPIISNFIGNILDIRILKLSKQEKCYYSRYADDLTFSTNNKQFPTSIAFEKDNQWIVGEKLQQLIENSGFKINEMKTTMQYKHSRQTCVGLIVNKKVNVKKEYYKKIRAMCNNLFKKNTFFINNDGEEYFNNQLEGMINFVYTIKRKYDKRRMGERNGKPSPISKLYRKFLLLKYFIDTDRPVILTEGKSDIVYLKCALKNLKDKYPELITMNDDKYCFNIKFFKSSKLFRDVFSIAEGTSGLRKLMEYYKKEIDTFIHHKTYTPIIIILDNDDGAKEIRDMLGMENEEAYFNCFHKKMYILFVDKNRNTKIENLFENIILNEKIDGKIFEPDDKKMNSNTNYGKHIFAQKVILPKYKTINFEKFKPIFDNILVIMSECNKKSVEKVI